MNNKIEPGCLAMIINSKAGNNGICVTVGEFIGKPEDIRAGNTIYIYPDDCWYIDKTLIGTSGVADNLISEKLLMRIDGYKETETDQPIAEKVK